MKPGTGRRERGRPGGRPPARPRRASAGEVPGAVGVDTGGTFTDFVALVGRRVLAFKLPSTPRHPHRATLAGLSLLRAGLATRVRYGSTIATNALLERKGARVAFVTTAGFEDLLEIGRQDRPDLYALAPRRIAPLVPAARRIGARERTGPRGEVWRALGASEVARVVERTRRARPRVVAVGLLHAYANPTHENRLARALAVLGVPVVTSAGLCAEVREYERFATTVTNAYLLPRVSANLERIARGTRARVEIVLSHGGTAPVLAAAREPVRQLLSGPAAGVRAARDVARDCGFGRALSLDVGGTSTDCAFVDGVLPRRRGREVGGFPVHLPLLDVHTIGAGGGSIARVDAGGLLHVGPESAGAEPGPACYGGGGPGTLTDALVVLGRIPGDSLAGGAIALDRPAAGRAMERVARELRVRDAAAAAAGVVRVAEASMAAALRKVSVERGHDPRDAALVAFGGAGGLHACALAESLGCRAVVFPRHAGLLSAIGALTGGSRRERSRSVLAGAHEHARLTGVLRQLERELVAGFEHDERPRLRVERWVEVRYRGQSHELPMRFGPDLEARFHSEHRRRFGFDDPGAAVEVVTLEVRAAVPGARLPARADWSEPVAGPPEAGARAAGRARTAGLRVVSVHHGGRIHRVGVRPREAIEPGFRARGPLIVTESGATLWVPPGWNARCDPGGAIVLSRGRR